MSKKKKKLKLTISPTSVGTTLSNTPYSLVISSPTSHSEELLKISSDGNIFYRHKGEMVKVNCPDDITEAFLWSVFHFTGQQPEDVIIEKYIQKILNHDRSNEYITKLESAFRKLKLQKLKNSKL